MDFRMYDSCGLARWAARYISAAQVICDETRDMQHSRQSGRPLMIETRQQQAQGERIRDPDHALATMLELKQVMQLCYQP